MPSSSRSGDSINGGSATMPDFARRLGRDIAPPNEPGEDIVPLGGRVTKNDVIYLTNQLAIMVATGVTLSSALQSILEQEKNGALKRVLIDLRATVETGEDFSTALKKHPKLFDNTYVSLVRASEQTGTLAAMLDRISVYQRKELETRGKVRSALAYPTVMLSIAIVVTIFLLTWVLPRFAPLFKKKGADLPKSTKFMMMLSESLLNYWHFWILGVVALIVGFIVWKRSGAGRVVWDTIRLQLPVVGTLSRKVTLSRSVRTLGSMLAGGVPVLDALSLCRDVSGNVHYQRLWDRVIEDVTSGKRIADSLANTPLMPPTLVQMIRAGEETANLGSVLEKVSNYYDVEVDQSIKSATSMIEPIMISVMGVIVGGIGLSLLLPIFTLSGKH